MIYTWMWKLSGVITDYVERMRRIIGRESHKKSKEHKYFYIEYRNGRLGQSIITKGRVLFG